MSPARFVATWFGAGLAPKAPGTFGTLAAIPLYLLAWWAGAPPWMLVPLAVAIALLGVAVSGAVARELDQKDPQEIVIDEVAGFLFAVTPPTLVAQYMGARPYDLRILLPAVILFRVLDIWKPWPISRMQDLPGGWGVMVDDLVAGGIVGAALATTVAWVPGFVQRGS